MSSRRLLLTAAPACLLAACSGIPATSTVAPTEAARSEGEIGHLTYRAVDRMLAAKEKDILEV